MTDRTVKIAFFHNECYPTRLPLFTKISELPNVDLTIYFGEYRSSDRRWKPWINVPFKWEILRVLPGAEMFFDTSNPANPSLFFKLVSRKYDVFIGGVSSYVGTIVTFSAAKLLRKPFILFLEDMDYPTMVYRSRVDSFLGMSTKRKIQNLTSYLISNTFSRIILKHSSAYVVPGVATKEYLLHRNVDASKIFTAVNAIDNDYFERESQRLRKDGAPERLKENLGLKGKKVILYSGRLMPLKGVQHLIVAVSQLGKECPNAKLVIVGAGEYRDQLVQLAEKYDVDVLFAGYHEGLDLITYYLIADVLVLPSLNEVWGFVINEAMVCGLPVIATKNTGASKDLIMNGTNGYVVDAGNRNLLRLALLNILSNPLKARLMGQASSEIIKNYSYDKSVQGFKSAIANALHA